MKESTKEKKTLFVEKKVSQTIKENFMPLLIAVAFAYFAFGAITNVAGAIVPKIRDTYQVSSSWSSLLAAVFFIAYGVTSIPWGVFMEKVGKKQTLIWGSVITGAGVCLFAAIPGFYFNMLAMFLCGLGITGLQVALNPLVKEISNPAKYSRNLTLFMVINGVGSYLAPQVVTFVKTQGFEWTYTYWIFTAISAVMLLAIAFPKYPKDPSKEGVHEASTGDPAMQSSSTEQVQEQSCEEAHDKNLTLELLTSKPLIYLYAVGIFLYVGVEVGVANTIGFYLEDKFNIAQVMGDAAEATKNTVISNYWGGLLLGRLVGSAVLDKIKGKTAIKVYITLAAVSLYVAMTSDLNIALWAFPAVGFFISIMFPTIYSLTTHSFPHKYASAISGTLCTAIIGGAVIGPVIAKVAEMAQGSAAIPNWDTGLLVAFVCYAYIFAVGLFAPEESK